MERNSQPLGIGHSSSDNSGQSYMIWGLIYISSKTFSTEGILNFLVVFCLTIPLTAGKAFLEFFKG
jgi:hypothetical protein